jgi:hypothetical protein
MQFLELVQETMGPLERKDSEQYDDRDSNPPSKKQSLDITNEVVDKEELIQKRK